MTQLVTGDRVVCLDRRRNITLDEAGVRDKFGVDPESIPDYLALVGDSADGIPGVPRWGAKSTALMLARYSHIEKIPEDVDDWDVRPRGARAMADSLREHADAAPLYRHLATLRLDVPLPESLADLEWRGARRPDYQALCVEYGFERLLNAPHEWAAD